MKKLVPTVLVFCSLLVAPTKSYSGNWETVKAALKNDSGQYNPLFSYEIIRDALKLMVNPSLIQYLDQEQAYVVDGGYIILDRQGLRSYSKATGYRNFEDHEDLEFQQIFPDNQLSSDSDSGSGEIAQMDFSQESKTQQPLKGAKIILDGLTENAELMNRSYGKYFNGTTYQPVTYSKFIEWLLIDLHSQLLAHGASEVQLSLRQKVYNFRAVREINQKKPKNLVLSVQLNAHNHGKYMTMCEGHYLPTELDKPRWRMRFIYSLLTNRSVSSIALGACIAHDCQNDLRMPLMEGDAYYFSNNGGMGVSALDSFIQPTIQAVGGLNTTHRMNHSYYDGICTRNLAHNGFYAKDGVVQVFPSSAFIEEEIAKSPEQHPLSWITQFNKSLVNSLSRYYRQKH